jgi:hypothetical protein
MENLSVRPVSKIRDSLAYYRMYSILKSRLPSFVGQIEFTEFSSAKNLYHRALFSNKDVVGGMVLFSKEDAIYLAFMAHTGGFHGSGRMLVDDAKDLTRSLGRPILRLETKPDTVHKFERYGFVKNSERDRWGMYSMAWKP